MQMEVLQGILIPFLGTTLGSACVLFMKKSLNPMLQRALTGFAAGVMVAASIWSLLIPAMEQSQSMGQWAFVPAAVGFWLGILFLLVLDRTVPHLHMNSNKAEGPESSLQKTTMLVLAVTLHNLPEGMAVGVVYAGWLSGDAGTRVRGGVGVPSGVAEKTSREGATTPVPLGGGGGSRGKASLSGALPGAVGPVGAALTILAAGFVVPLLPYLLSFAAGAMVYVVVEELVPEMSAGKHSNVGTVLFAAGFTVMMALDVALG